MFSSLLTLVVACIMLFGLTAVAGADPLPTWDVSVYSVSVMGDKYGDPDNPSPNNGMLRDETHELKMKINLDLNNDTKIFVFNEEFEPFDANPPVGSATLVQYVKVNNLQLGVDFDEVRLAINGNAVATPILTETDLNGGKPGFVAVVDNEDGTFTTFFKHYLDFADLNGSDWEVKADYSVGAKLTYTFLLNNVEVGIYDEYRLPRILSGSKITPKKAVFDRYTGGRNYDMIIVRFESDFYNVIGLKNGDKNLVERVDYFPNSPFPGEYLIDVDYFMSLPKGDYFITFETDGGEAPKLDLWVTDSFPQNNPFTDVKESNWFYDHVSYLYGVGWMKGTSPTTFSPHDPLSRGMAVTILWRFSGETNISESDYDLPFTDVKVGSYYDLAIRWAADKGIVNGISKSKFAPNAGVTRQDLAVMLERYAEKHENKPMRDLRPYAAFNDQNDISSYAESAVKDTYEAKIINGKPHNLFAPKAFATRAEAAAMLHRFMRDMSSYPAP